MRLNLFEKAKYLLDSKQVKITAISDYSISFEVGKYHVVGKYKNHQLIWICDCRADTNGDLCAHKIAAQNYLTIGELGKIGSIQEIPVMFFEKFVIGLQHLSDAQKLVLRQMTCFRCQDCHKHEDEVGKLEAHRIIRGADGGLYIPQNIKMLCKECHDKYDY
jgi:hypothetical protein